MIAKKYGMFWCGLINWFAPNYACVDEPEIRRRIASIVSSRTTQSSVAVYDCGDEVYVDDGNISIHWFTRPECSDDDKANNQKA